MVVTISQIKKQVQRVNTGENVDTDYANLRRLQKAFAKSFLEEDGREMKPGDIRHLNVRDFPCRFTLRVRKYRIDCNRQQSTVWHIETFKDMPLGKSPNYIREFLGA